jgi:hypothetical protein
MKKQIVIVYRMYSFYWDSRYSKRFRRSISEKLGISQTKQTEIADYSHPWFVSTLWMTMCRMVRSYLSAIVSHKVFACLRLWRYQSTMVAVAQPWGYYGDSRRIAQLDEQELLLWPSVAMTSFGTNNRYFVIICRSPNNVKMLVIFSAVLPVDEKPKKGGKGGISEYRLSITDLKSFISKSKSILCGCRLF